MIDGPFVWAANGLLSKVLQNDYDLDPIFTEFTGLAVKPLYTNLRSAETKGILQGEFESPGNDAIWPHDYKSEFTEVPAPIRKWIAQL